MNRRGATRPRRHNEGVDRELRDWLRSLAVAPGPGEGEQALSDADASYLERIAGDGTLAAALAEIAATEPELAG